MTAAPGPVWSRPWLGRLSLGLLVLFVLSVGTLGYWAITTGNYQPKIPVSPPAPAPNGFDDYVAAGSMLRANGGTKAVTDAAKPTLAAKRALVVRNQPALARVRRAFGKRCQVPAVRDFGTRFPYLADSRDLARLLAADADLRMAEADWADAFSDGLDAYQMGEDLARGGSVIHGLVCAALTAIARRPMIASLEHLSVPECDRLARRMQPLLLSRVPAPVILREERYTLLAGVEKAASDGSPVADLDAEEHRKPRGRGGRLASGLVWHFMRDAALRAIEEHMGAAEREAARPPTRRYVVPEPRNPIARIVALDVRATLARFDETDVHSRAILCALAIRRYRLAHGRLPATLDELGLDPSLLEDPYTGGRLTYRPAGSDYLLYGVGPNGKDDGGVPVDNGGDATRGDLGMRRFQYHTTSGQIPKAYYRRVPHMKPPVLPPGAPPLPNE